MPNNYSVQCNCISAKSLCDFKPTWSRFNRIHHSLCSLLLSWILEESEYFNWSAVLCMLFAFRQFSWYFGTNTQVQIIDFCVKWLSMISGGNAAIIFGFFTKRKLLINRTYRMTMLYCFLNSWLWKKMGKYCFNILIFLQSIFEHSHKMLLRNLKINFLKGLKYTIVDMKSQSFLAFKKILYQVYIFDLNCLSVNKVEWECHLTLFANKHWSATYLVCIVNGYQSCQSRAKQESDNWRNHIIWRICGYDGALLRYRLCYNLQHNGVGWGV